MQNIRDAAVAGSDPSLFQRTHIPWINRLRGLPAASRAILIFVLALGWLILSPQAARAAATLDIASFVLTYTGSAVNNNLTVSVTGGVYTFTDSGETITLGAGATGAGWTGSGTNTVTGSSASFITISINTDGGNDTVNMQSVLHSTSIDTAVGVPDVVNVGNAGSLAGISGPINVTDSGGVGALHIDGSAATMAASILIDSTRVTGAAPAAIGFGLGITDIELSAGSGGNTITIDKPVTGSGTILTVHSGTGVDNVNLRANKSTSVNIDGQDGADTVGIGDNGTVQGIDGFVNVSNALGSTALNVDDSVNPSVKNVTLNNTSISGLTAGGIFYTTGDIRSLSLKGGNGDSTFTVANTIPNIPTTLSSSGGANTFNVQSTATGSTLAINAGSGADTFNVGNGTNSLDDILTPITVSGGDGADGLTLDDTGDTDANTYGLNSGDVTRNSMPLLTYSTLEALNINGGTAADTFNVQQGPVATTTIDGNDPTTAPGDVLNYNAQNRAAARTPAAGSSGVITSPSTAPVNFSDIETAGITNELNEPPVITQPGSQVTAEDIPLVFSTGSGNAISIADPDANGGTLTVELSVLSGTLATNGTSGVTGSGTGDITIIGTLAAINARLNGLTFSPPANFNGQVDLTVDVDDGGNTGNDGAKQDSGAVLITVTPVNDAPVAQNDSYTLAGTSLVVTAAGVLGNDSDAENTVLTAAVVANPAHGSLTLNPNGGFTYTPQDGFRGTDSFTYRAGDGTLQSNVATVTLNVEIANTPTLSLSINPATIAENAGNGAAIGTVARSGSTASALTVVLFSSDSSEATVPTTVTIAAGSNSANFAINAIDDNADDGNQTVTITATANGLVGDTSTLTVTDDDNADVVAPTVAFTAPTDGQLLQGFPAVRGTASDNQGSVSTVTVRLRRVLDDRYWTGATYSSTAVDLPTTLQGNSWVLDADLPTGSLLLDGKYVLQATATDNGGNTGSAQVTVTIDKSAPRIAFTSPLNNARLTTFPAITGTAFDGPAGSGVQRVLLTLRRAADGRYWNGSAWVTAASTVQAALTGNVAGRTFRYTGTSPSGANLLAGIYYLSAVAFDATGARDQAVVSFRILDVSAPTVTITSPANGATVSQLTSITGTIAEEATGTGIAGVTLLIRRSSDGAYWNGAHWVQTLVALRTTLSGTGNERDWTSATPLPAAPSIGRDTYFITALGYDRSGNRGVATVSVTATNEPSTRAAM